MSQWTLWWGFVCILAHGCAPDTADRIAYNESIRFSQLTDELSISVRGASITQTEVRGVQEVDFKPHFVRIRAQSLDVRIDLMNSQCRPTVFHLEVSHVHPAALHSSKRDFYEGLNPLIGAVREAGAAVTQLKGDEHDSDRSPIGPETTFEFETATDHHGVIRWTVCMDQPRGLNRIIPGHVSAQSCNLSGLENPQGVCALHEANRSLGVASSPLVGRFRLRQPVDGSFQFAVWGNNAGQWDLLDELIASVNTSPAIFAIITGDLTNSGKRVDLQKAQEILDSRLTVPWFATLGDRDVLGEAGIDYGSILGASSFAFDAGLLRLVVLDSADRKLRRDQLEFMSASLSSDSLWWNGPTPSGQMVFTHIPPFDTSGTRDTALSIRSEGASLVARLRRSRVGHLITSQFEDFKKVSFGSVDIVHAGGASSTTKPYWLLVSVDPECAGSSAPVPQCEGSSTATMPCPCIRIERQFLQ